MEERCPKCGQTILASALDNHLKYFCPNRDKDDCSVKVSPPVVASEAKQEEQPQGGIPIPPREPNFWIAPQNRQRLSRIASRSERGDCWHQQCLYRS
jgi:hypothetical protein